MLASPGQLVVVHRVVASGARYGPGRGIGHHDILGCRLTCSGLKAIVASLAERSTDSGGIAATCFTPPRQRPCTRRSESGTPRSQLEATNPPAGPTVWPSGCVSPEVSSPRRPRRCPDVPRRIAARGHSIRVVRTAIEVAVLSARWLLGSLVGVGTLIDAFAIEPLVHLLLPPSRWTRLRPRRLCRRASGELTQRYSVTVMPRSVNASRTASTSACDSFPRSRKSSAVRIV